MKVKMKWLNVTRKMNTTDENKLLAEQK